MVATGARVRALAALLTDGGWTQVASPPLARLADLPKGQRDRIKSLYDGLGGAPDQFDRIRPGGWDLAFRTSDDPDSLLLVELDEEQHFNRYRAQTLTGTEDLTLPWAPAYHSYSQAHEQRLLPGWGTGKRWTNPSAARFFGDPSPPGDFTNVGAPRWRQRAFYDAIKDTLTERRLARISVHDTAADGATVESMLRRPDATGIEALRTLAVSRVHKG